MWQKPCCRVLQETDSGALESGAWMEMMLAFRIITNSTVACGGGHHVGGRCAEVCVAVACCAGRL